MTIFELMDLINTKEKALKLFRRIRWQEGLYCQKCGLFDHVHKHGRTKTGFMKYKCLECMHVFSDTSGTPFHKRRGEVRHWLFALYELSQNKSITSVELADKTGLKQKQAWSMLDFLRSHCLTLMKPFYNLLLRGVVESDEAYFGKGKNAQMVQGIVQRGKLAIILPISDRTEATLKGNLEVRVMKHSTIITDTASGYGGLSCWGYNHHTLNHSKEEFSKGNGIHSNTIEGLWGNQKKQLYGIHHGVSKKRLFNYVSEFLLKYNLKKANNTFTAFLQLFISPPLTC